MTAQTPAIYEMARSMDLDYPRLLASHPRNAHVDFSEVAAYAEHGAPGEIQYDLYLRSRRSSFDAVWMSGIAGPAVSTRLRAVLEPVAGAGAVFLPISVNGQEFWIIRAPVVPDRLDVEASDIEWSVSGTVLELNRPAWRRSALAESMLFRIPQLRYTIWATPEVAAAYRGSDCDGLHFGERGRVI